MTARVISKKQKDKRVEADVFSLYFALHKVTAFGFVGSIRFSEFTSVLLCQLEHSHTYRIRRFLVRPCGQIAGLKFVTTKINELTGLKSVTSY